MFWCVCLWIENYSHQLHHCLRVYVYWNRALLFHCAIINISFQQNKRSYWDRRSLSFPPFPVSLCRATITLQMDRRASALFEQTVLEALGRSFSVYAPHLKRNYRINILQIERRQRRSAQKPTSTTMRKLRSPESDGNVIKIVKWNWNKNENWSIINCSAERCYHELTHLRL